MLWLQLPMVFRNLSNTSITSPNMHGTKCWRTYRIFDVFLLWLIAVSYLFFVNKLLKNISHLWCLVALTNSDVIMIFCEWRQIWSRLYCTIDLDMINKYIYTDAYKDQYHLIAFSENTAEHASKKCFSHVNNLFCHSTSNEQPKCFPIG